MIQNIFLMGAPGAGKTSVGKFLAEKLGMDWLDIDDDYLEPYWGISVAEKLKMVGDEGFVSAEGDAVMELKVKNTLVSLSGSNPLHSPTMQHLKQMGKILFLDTPKEIILNRLHKMHVNRIVGQSTKTLSEVLDYRSGFYEKYYDYRIPIFSGESPEKIADNVMLYLEKREGFLSTRGYCQSGETFLDVVRQGLAPDGGLYIPKKLPKFSYEEIHLLKNKTYVQRARRVLEKFSLGGITPQKLKKILKEAYSPFFDSRVAPLKKISRNEYLLELFHGPTASFKDMALQLTPKFFAEANKMQNENFLLLTATSGDTGIAAIEGFKKEEGMKVMVLYPKNGVSPIQKAQMQSAEGENIHVVGVDADFDFCQSMVKQIFSYSVLKKDLKENFCTRLSAANSMNWGRLLPQVIYYFSLYADLIKNGEILMGDTIEVCVPTGNFGNILAGYIAKQMGLPIEKFICASNENNVLTDFINTGVYDLRDRELTFTDSPSIDILISSNVERFLYFISDGDTDFVTSCFENLKKTKYFTVSREMLTKIQENFSAGFATQEDMKKMIPQILHETGEVIDPHTAVGVTVSRKFESEKKRVIASTAHFAKFAHTIVNIFAQNGEGEDLFSIIEDKAPRSSQHPNLKDIFSKEKIHTKNIEGSYEAIVDEMKEFLGK